MFGHPPAWRGHVPSTRGTIDDSRRSYSDTHSTTSLSQSTYSDSSSMTRPPMMCGNTYSSTPLSPSTYGGSTSTVRPPPTRVSAYSGLPFSQTIRAPTVLQPSIETGGASRATPLYRSSTRGGESQRVASVGRNDTLRGARGTNFDPSRFDAPAPGPAMQHQPQPVDLRKKVLTKQQGAPMQGARGTNFDPSRFAAPKPVGIAHNVDQTFQSSDVLISGYRKLTSLTPGGQSVSVNLVQSKQDGKLFVEKRIRTDDRSTFALREVHTLMLVSDHYGPGGHLNSMTQHKFVQDDQIMSMILEYCDGGSLDDVLRKAVHTQIHFSEAEVWNVTYGICAGLAFLHDGVKQIQPNGDHPKTPDWNTVCHLDVKPQNVFLDQKGGLFGLPRVVLGDFGCAVSLQEIQNGSEDHEVQPCGTPMWFPPEGIDGRFYGTRTDMFAAGLITHCLCRLATSPLNIGRYDRGNLCGSLYGARLNGTARSLTSSESKNRPSARVTAATSLAVLMEKAK